jgi:hypothetical protein
MNAARCALLAHLLLVSFAFAGCAAQTEAQTAFRVAPPSALPCLDGLPSRGWTVEQDAPPSRLLSRLTATGLTYAWVYASPVGALVAVFEAQAVLGPVVAPNDVLGCIDPPARGGAAGGP